MIGKTAQKVSNDWKKRKKKFQWLETFPAGRKYWSDGTQVAGQEYGYAFDDIGNRTYTTNNGIPASYTANLLNQYTERTIPGKLNILGTANANAYISINNQPANRQGEYYHIGLEVTNTSGS